MDVFGVLWLFGSLMITGYVLGESLGLLLSLKRSSEREDRDREKRDAEHAACLRRIAEIERWKAAMEEARGK